jgi:hypothetical protein
MVNNWQMRKSCLAVPCEIEAIQSMISKEYFGVSRMRHRNACDRESINIARLAMIKPDEKN